MASSGPNFAGTGADDGTGPSSATVTWTNTSRITAEDASNSTATVSLGGISHWLKATNFGFSIPSGATIDGIVIEWKRIRTGTRAVLDNAVRVIKGGTVGSTELGAGGVWPTTLAYATYGGSSNLCGETWTDTDINASTFGAAISAVGSVTVGSAIAGIDCCRITVYYTESGGGTGQSAMTRFSGTPGMRLGGPTFGRGW